MEGLNTLAPKVVYVGALPEEELAKMVEAAPPGFRLVRLLPGTSSTDMVREFRDADFLICENKAGVTEEAYRAATKVKLVQSWGVGIEGLPMPLLHELGIPVANIAGANSVAVAEHAVALMLILLRNIIPSIAAAKAGKSRKDVDHGRYSQLYQKRVGIIGLGNQGRWVGRIVSGFGAEVVFYDIFRPPQTVAAMIPARQVPLDELLSSSDIVTLHLPLSKHSHKLIGQRELALMKPSAFLINAARGQLVDEAALIAALKEHRLAGAGLDVSEVEPISVDNPLLEMENVVYTPHLAGLARDNFPQRMEAIWGNLEAAWGGRRPPGLVSDLD